MDKISLTIATTDYDHFRDFRTGAVRAEGIEHIWLTLGHHEIFSRFTFNREWDVTELSFAKFAAQVTRPTPDIIGLPVFASRLFRFGSFYVNRNSGIKTAADLKGKSIGSPEWAHTAAVYMRGWLHHDAGVRLEDVHWYQAGANEAGRIEKVELNLPPGVRLTRVADRSLSEMVASASRLSTIRRSRAPSRSISACVSPRCHAMSCKHLVSAGKSSPGPAPAASVTAASSTLTSLSKH
jgi:4,5-dihydroxyphthalate decarboxylase